jgi:hypothetical protein
MISEGSVHRGGENMVEQSSSTRKQRKEEFRTASETYGP